jgi:hypothetical protein
MLKIRDKFKKKKIERLKTKEEKIRRNAIMLMKIKTDA